MIYINENIKLLFFVIYLHMYCILHLELLLHHRISLPWYTVVNLNIMILIIEINKL